MTYLGYPVTFGYLEKTVLKGGESYTHRGIDLGAFTGQPVMVSGTQIGLAGETGKAEGPHVHIQAGRDEWAQATIDPSPYIGKPGTVVKTGYADQWGNYVCIKVGDVYVYYCHLSRIDVKVGQVIGEEEMKPSYKEVLTHFRGFAGHDPTESQMNYYVARPWGVLNGDLLQYVSDRRAELTAKLNELSTKVGLSAEDKQRIKTLLDQADSATDEIDKIINK